MKVVHVFWSLMFGGIETMLVNITNAQAQSNANVYIIIINDNCDKTLINALNRNVRVVFLYRKLHSKGFQFIFKFNRALRKIKPDIIHLHDPHLFGLIFSRQLRNITCVTLHDVPYGSLCGSSILQRKILALNFRLAGNVVYLDKIPQVFSISNIVQKELYNKFGVDSIIVNNGIDTSRFKQRHQRGINQPMRLVQVSRLDHKKKGQDLLIKAVAKLKGRIEVDFVGDGESLTYLSNLSRKLDVEHYVHFLGKKSQSFIFENLQNYDLFVQPSRYEGFGLTVAEAMAAKVPVLVTEGEGPAEITCNEKYGWTFKNGDIDDLVNKIVCIQRLYAEAMDKAEKARLYVCNNYNVTVTARKYLEEYTNMKK
mgnify:CR=1 FL=1